MGITDGTVQCSLCGEPKTSCYLCGTAPMSGRETYYDENAKVFREGNKESLNDL